MRLLVELELAAAVAAVAVGAPGDAVEQRTAGQAPSAAVVDWGVEQQVQVQCS